MGFEGRKPDGDCFRFLGRHHIGSLAINQVLPGGAAQLTHTDYPPGFYKVFIRQVLCSVLQALTRSGWRVVRKEGGSDLGIRKGGMEGIAETVLIYVL